MTKDIGGSAVSHYGEDMIDERLGKKGFIARHAFLWLESLSEAGMACHLLLKRLARKNTMMIAIYSTSIFLSIVIITATLSGKSVSGLLWAAWTWACIIVACVIAAYLFLKTRERAAAVIGWMALSMIVGSVVVLVL